MIVLYILAGVVIGMLIAVLSILAGTTLKTEIQRTLRTTESKLKRKGKILELEDEELASWIDKLPTE